VRLRFVSFYLYTPAFSTRDVGVCLRNEHFTWLRFCISAALWLPIYIVRAAGWRAEL